MAYIAADSFRFNGLLSYIGMLSCLRGCCLNHPVCATQAKPIHFDQLLVVTCYMPRCKVHKASASCIERIRENTW
jgi:hypothetical protein